MTTETKHHTFDSTGNELSGLVNLENVIFFLDTYFILTIDL